MLGAPLLLFLALQADSALFEQNHRRGEERIRQNDPKGAAPFLRRAYRLNPADYTNGYDLALTDLQIGNLSEARAVLQEMLARTDKAELHNLLGDVEEASGNMLEAVRQLETAARAEPTEKNVFDLGLELLNHQGFQQATQIFEWGTSKYPQSARMQMGLGIAHYSLGRYSEAVETLCRAVDLDPKDTRALEFLGKVHDVSPEWASQVRERLANFVKLYPENAAANYYYGLSVEEPEAKEQFFHRAIQLKSRYPEAWLALGILHQAQGEVGKAIQELETAAQQAPTIKTVHYRLAQLYQKQGKKEKANQQLRIFQSLPSL